MLVETDIFGETIDKVQMSIDRIKAFEPPEGYYVAFSGGKDSVVILDLVKRSGAKFDAHYNITGIDPPELVRFIRDVHPEVKRNRPEITMWKLIVKKQSPPTRIARYCCQYLKERGGLNRRIITGVRWQESNRRRKRKMIDVCFKDSRKSYIHPIIDWLEKDIWDYIHENKVPYCSLYDEGFKRLGCIGCPNGGTNGMRRQFARWPRYEKLWRNAFDKAAKTPLSRHIDGDAMFKWWMEDKHTKEDPDQTVMFE
jgi:phosphoadenosine phosphosulfate reductase